MGLMYVLAWAGEQVGVMIHVHIHSGAGAYVYTRMKIHIQGDDVRPI
jgi:hypothetical protein